MSSIVIPQNLVKEVLIASCGYLADDTSTLRTCCLLSRDFMDSARRTLFDTIHIENSRRTFDSFAIFLIQNPHIGCYIRRLKLSGHDIDYEFQYMMRHTATPPRAILSMDTLASILIRLPNLHILEFRHLRFTPGLFKQSLRPISLQKLLFSFVGSRSDRLDNFTNILALFSNVEILHIGAMELRLTGSPMDQETVINELLGVPELRELKAQQLELYTGNPTLQLMCNIILKTPSVNTHLDMHALSGLERNRSLRTVNTEMWASYPAPRPGYDASNTRF
ncbi:unnamed protein product [Somion occarium]|uniref:F-box domain-containing protein n=1 Tax=Somion occarium TaxID=3059160 RepID=A0ABP1DST1_9APHY